MDNDESNTENEFNCYAQQKSNQLKNGGRYMNWKSFWPQSDMEQAH